MKRLVWLSGTIAAMALFGWPLNCNYAKDMLAWCSLDANMGKCTCDDDAGTCCGNQGATCNSFAPCCPAFTCKGDAGVVGTEGTCELP